jgi:tetratricopeptide (TPR) repeat protein
MRKLKFSLVSFLFFGLLFIPDVLFSQSIGLAMNYVEQGEYEKAKSIYENLYKKNPRKQDYVLGLSNVHVQLQEFNSARGLLEKYIGNSQNFPQIYVEIGHVYTIEQDTINAKIWYDKAIARVQENAGYAYNVGLTFQNYNLLDYAIQTYEVAYSERPQLNFSIQLARLYGEKGNVQKMFEKYISLIEENEKYIDVVQRNFNVYISDDPSNENNAILKKVLFKRLQQNPNVLYNQILSWLYIQEQAFSKAFAQEKAIYKRLNIRDFTRFFDLGYVMIDAEYFEDAIQVFTYIKDESQNIEFQLQAISAIMDAKISNEIDAGDINSEFEDYFEVYGYNAQTITLQLQYAEFLAFKRDRAQDAITVLENALGYNAGVFRDAQIQTLLADVLVAQESFNQALIKYSLVSKMVKNTPMAQEASYKTAMTSYYKGDFDWALTQLKVLKKATTQTIANDAIEMALFIKQGQTETDSTQQALRKVAKADLYVYQGKTKVAIDTLKSVFDVADNYHIKDQVFYKLGKAYEDIQDYDNAIKNYEALLQEYPESIVVDNAIFALANIYKDFKADVEKAKFYLEQLIFEHEDSIFFVEGRKLYRQLRGDQNI